MRCALVFFKLAPKSSIPGSRAHQVAPINGIRCECKGSWSYVVLEATLQAAVDWQRVSPGTKREVLKEAES